MHKDCVVCRSEGFVAHNRILLRAGNQQVIATLYHATSNLIAHDEAALSESAWVRLALRDGDMVSASHPEHLRQ
jgi:thymidine phosphorylase